MVDISSDYYLQYQAHLDTTASGPSELSAQSPDSSPVHEARKVLVSRDEARSSIASSEGSQNSLFGSSEEDYGQPIAGELGWFQARSSSVEFDEYQSSDEAPSGANNNSRKQAKRLPHQRDLASVYTVESLAPTIQSRHTYTDAESDHTNENVDPQEPEKQPILSWQLDYIDSEEDEPRDAEAALRRLEGHIDRDRQNKKETKVDGWLRQVEARRALARRENRNVEDRENGTGDQYDDEDESAGAFRLDHPSPLEGVDDKHAAQPPNVLPEGTEHSQPFPPLPEQTTSRTPGDATAHPVPWPGISVARKHATSLSHQPSFVKISGSRGGPLSLSSIHNHQSFILTARTLKIAQQFTRIESDLWRSVQVEDLIMSPITDLDPTLPILDWAEFTLNRDKYGSKFGRPSSALLAVRARFDITAMFTASEILMTAAPLRPILVEKFIKIAMVRIRLIYHAVSHLIQKCYALNNFSSMIAIIYGLNLPPIQAAIERMPRAIRKQEARMFDGLQSFSSLDGNYRSVRKAIAKLVASSRISEPTAPGPLNPTTTMADASCACIPFIGWPSSMKRYIY